MEFREGRKAVVVRETWYHGFDLGEEIFFTGESEKLIISTAYRFENANSTQLIRAEDFEWVEE